MLPFTGSAMVHVVVKPEASCFWHAAHADRKLHRSEGKATGKQSEEFAASSVVLETLIRIFDTDASVDSSKERAPNSHSNKGKNARRYKRSCGIRR